MRSPKLRAVILLFVVILSTIVVRATYLYRAIDRIIQSQEQVADSYTALAMMDILFANLVEINGLDSKFAASHNSLDAERLRQAEAAGDSEIKRLLSLGSRNHTWQKSIDHIQSQFADLKQQTETALLAPQGSESFLSDSLLEAILSELNQTRSEELALLNDHNRATIASIQTMQQGVILASLGIASLLCLGLYIVLRSERERTDATNTRLRLAAIVDSSQDAIIGKTLDGTITSWNHSAETFYGYTEAEAIGKSIFMIVPPEAASQMRDIFAALLRGERVQHLETTRLKHDGTRITVDLTVSPIRNSAGKVIGASAIGRDVTKRKLQEESIRELSSRILHSQDEERRRIARELHDTTVQKLSLISMNLSQMRDIRGVSEDAGYKASQELTVECLQELRTLSYLLHPPMLDELGLPSALRIYGEGFSQRSGISVSVNAPQQWRRLSPDIEMSLFRIAQESLTNVLRHSGSKTAEIHLSQNGETALEIADAGRGMQHGPDKVGVPVRVGVGIAGMRERLRQFDGTLQLESTQHGTTVRAVLPNSGKVNGKDTHSYSG